MKSHARENLKSEKVLTSLNLNLMKLKFFKALKAIFSPLGVSRQYLKPKWAKKICPNILECFDFRFKVLFTLSLGYLLFTISHSGKKVRYSDY